MKPRRCVLDPLNLSGTLTLGSRSYEWEEEGIGLGVDEGVAQLVGGCWMCHFEALVMIHERFHFLVDVVASLPLLGLS